MSRTGTVTILGAGASADAGYPTAGELFSKFKAVVKAATEDELREREQIIKERARVEREAETTLPGRKVVRVDVPFRPQPTTAEWFERMWSRFVEVAARLRPLAVPRVNADGGPDLRSPVIYGPEGVPTFPPYTAPVENEPPSPTPTPYLESFFSFYDDLMRPVIAAAQGDPGRLTEVQHRFRRLRDLAIQIAYQVFSAYGRPPATYLRRLFDLRGPDKYRSAMATLNFDVTVEQLVADLGLAVADGFSAGLGRTSPLPKEWNKPGMENLAGLWNATARNSREFVGLGSMPGDSNLVLKLHGSLGWYVLEEGGRDIGSRDELRHNTAYEHFRIPYDLLWKPEFQPLVDQLALGGSQDPVTRADGASLSRKAGAIWVRPYIMFARALKTHPDRLYLDLVGTFGRLLDGAATILVVGYSWGDPHVNDLVFDAVARGANLVNVSRQAKPVNPLALWLHRYPTTFRYLRHRLFMFGGGARRALEQNELELPSGELREFDLITALPSNLPEVFSLGRTLG